MQVSCETALDARGRTQRANTSRRLTARACRLAPVNCESQGRLLQQHCIQIRGLQLSPCWCCGGARAGRGGARAARPAGTAAPGGGRPGSCVSSGPCSCFACSASAATCVGTTMFSPSTCCLPSVGSASLLIFPHMTPPHCSQPCMGCSTAAAATAHLAGHATALKASHTHGSLALEPGRLSPRNTMGVPLSSTAASPWSRHTCGHGGGRAAQAQHLLACSLHGMPAGGGTHTHMTRRVERGTSM